MLTYEQNNERAKKRQGPQNAILAADLDEIRDDHEVNGGVLLNMGDHCEPCYVVVDAGAAHEMRSEMPWDYWLALGAAGYDETRIYLDRQAGGYVATYYDEEMGQLGHHQLTERATP